MSTPFYDLASLVVVPSGYKASKVYAQKPLTTDGQLAFTRASTATRVGPDGLIEKVRTNLQTYSQNFTSAGGWGGDPVTATANYGTAPDGTTTSTRLVFGSANQVWQKSISGLNGNLGVFSLYIKGTAAQTISINDGFVDKVITLTSGWTRVSSNGNVASSSNININTYSSVSARDFEVWGGQVELGDIATPYIPTTTAAVSVGMLANVPRLDYLNSSCPRLLLEGQRTNLSTYSEQLDNTAGWTKQSTLVTANATTSPDGNTNADKLIGTAANTFHAIYNFNGVLTGNHTLTFYAKKAEYDFIVAHDQFSSRFLSVFNLNTGVVVSGSGSSMQSVGNGWYRCIVRFDGAGATVIFSLSPSPTSSSGTNYLGDGTSGVFVWGAQLEAGAYATSYIPTLGAAVTRGADACSKTGISSLIGQSEGTLFCEVSYKTLASTARFITISNGTVNNLVQFYLPPNLNTLLAYIAINGTVVFNGNVKALTNINAFFKIAMAYKNGNTRIYVDGQLLQTITTSFSSGTFDRFNFANQTGGQAFEGEANSVLIFPTALSNSDLAALTA